MGTITGTTARKNAARGVPAPASPSAQPAAPDVEAQPEGNEEPPVPKDEWPDGVEVLPDGTWMYDLQFDPEPNAAGARDIVSRPLKVRIPAKLWARNLREATANATGDGDLLFYLTCSMIRLPSAVVDRFDARDYSVISSRVNEVLLGNAHGAH